MKKFTKLFLSCAAVAALTAALAVSASAEALRPASNSTGLAGTYEDEDGTLTITAVPEVYTDAQQTILVLEADTTPVAGATTNIRVIDQVADVKAQGVTFKLDKTKVDATNKTYYVLLGGTSGNIYQAEFGKVSGTTVLVGDADQNKKISGQDARTIALYMIDKAELTDTAKKAADADMNKKVSGQDARAIALYMIDKAPADSKIGTEQVITYDVN